VVKKNGKKKKIESVMRLKVPRKTGIFMLDDPLNRELRGDAMWSVIDPRVKVVIINYPSIRIKNPSESIVDKQDCEFHHK
jgi:hypothetical protein